MDLMAKWKLTQTGGKTEQTVARRSEGVAVTDSADGMVTVDIGGEAIDAACVSAVKAGDLVQIIIQDGKALVLGAAGWGDSISVDIKNESDRADDIQNQITAAVVSVEHVSTSVETLENSVDTEFENLVEYIDGKTEVVDTWIRQGSTGTTPFMELGTTASSFNARLTVSKLSFLQDDTELAYFGNSKMHISVADIDTGIVDKLAIGEYALISNSDGHLTVLYTG